MGDIRLHTVLLFSDQGVATCNAIGLLCQDIYGVYPNTAPADYPLAARQVARWLLQQLAARGNGVFQEFRNQDIQNLGLGALDYTSLARKNVLKTLIVQLPAQRAQREREGGGQRRGRPQDDQDQPFVNGSNQFIGDSDGDCFDDDFEVIHSDLGLRRRQEGHPRLRPGLSAHAATASAGTPTGTG